VSVYSTNTTAATCSEATRHELRGRERALFFTLAAVVTTGSKSAGVVLSTSAAMALNTGRANSRVHRRSHAKVPTTEAHTRAITLRRC